MKPASLAEIQNAIRHLVTAVANAKLYSIDHPQIQRLCEAGRQCFENLLQEHSEISLMMVEGEILYKDFPLPSGLHTQKFSRLMEQHHIHRLIVLPGVDRDEIGALIAYLVQLTLADSQPPHGRHLRLETLLQSSDPQDNTHSKDTTPTDADILWTVKSQKQHQLAEIFDGFAREKPIKVTGLEEIVSGFISAFQREIPSLLTLMPLRTMDEYTFTHGLNVCLLNLAQAMNLGIQGELLHDIGIAALLHDIGKLSIPMEILGKPGKLDDKEWHIMKQHPTDGAQRLIDSPGVPQLAVITAFEHHIRYDLSGYPAVDSQWRQHLCSQLTTISDIYDAIRTKRPYSPPQPAEKCAEILRKMAGRELHPQLAANFLYLLDQATPHSEQQEAVIPGGNSLQEKPVTRGQNKTPH